MYFQWMGFKTLLWKSSNKSPEGDDVGLEIDSDIEKDPDPKPIHCEDWWAPEKDGLLESDAMKLVAVAGAHAESSKSDRFHRVDMELETVHFHREAREGELSRSKANELNDAVSIAKVCGVLGFRNQEKMVLDLDKAKNSSSKYKDTA